MLLRLNGRYLSLVLSDSSYHCSSRPHAISSHTTLPSSPLSFRNISDMLYHFIAHNPPIPCPFLPLHQWYVVPFHRTQPSHPLPFPSVTSVICCIFSATGIRVTSPKGSRTLHLQTSGEKAYNVACLSTPGENWVPSARQNRKILYTLLKQKRR